MEQKENTVTGRLYTSTRFMAFASLTTSIQLGEVVDHASVIHREKLIIDVQRYFTTAPFISGYRLDLRVTRRNLTQYQCVTVDRRTTRESELLYGNIALHMRTRDVDEYSGHVL